MPNTVKVTLTLPIRGTKKKPYIDFDFNGTAEGIKKATGINVVVNYSYRGRYEVPDVTVS